MCTSLTINAGVLQEGYTSTIIAGVVVLPLQCSPQMLSVAQDQTRAVALTVTLLADSRRCYHTGHNLPC
jgi:hypothetical protein